MKTPLFDVIITAYVDTETGRPSHTIRAVARYREHDGELIGEGGFGPLDEALEFAREKVTEFLKGTQA
jgi:hypothetical protein